MGYCANCKYGEAQGLGIKCDRIEENILICVGGEPLQRMDIDGVIVPLTFGCIEYEAKDSAEEELI